MTRLVPSGQSTEDLDKLRARVAERETTLAERAAEADRLNADLTSFAALYRHHVGTLHEQLDQLQLDIAEAELAILSGGRAEETGGGDDRGRERGELPPTASNDPPAARFTSDSVRKLFREVARAIHPDLARDEDARTRRHALMAAANQAYALGDADQLRRILERWERGPDDVLGIDETAIRLRFERRLAQIDELIEMYARDRAALEATPLYELKVQVDAAAARGRDLIADMVARLKRDIIAARNRLDAMRFTP